MSQLDMFGVPAEVPPEDALEPRIETPTDAVEQAIVRFLGRTGTGWATASLVSLTIGHPRREVEAALARMAGRGEAERMVEWAGHQVVALWRFKYRLR
jgi:hypothetical protein